ncbi:MAG: glucokinase [Pseudomonadota bacterium]
MTAPVLLIGDIGGTNARFALADPERPAFDQVVKLACSEYPTALDAIEHYLDGVGMGRPSGVCLAAAGPIVNGSVRFTNNHWAIDGAELQAQLGARSVRLLNDFEAIALSLPFLSAGVTQPIGLVAERVRVTADFTVGVLGPGTGLGVAGLLCRDGLLHPVVGEGGHRGFAPETAQQIEVLSVLRERFERVSDERLLSGPGLVNIFEALNRVHGSPGERLDAADIFERAQRHEDRLALEAVKLFFEVLGQAAGNLALELGAFDGIYIAGGIVKRYPDLLEASGFRAAFEHKGRHRSLMERTPTHLITHDDPGLLGAAYGALSDQGAATTTSPEKRTGS